MNRPRGLPAGAASSYYDRMETEPRGRAAELIRELGLTPHPEGGYFREIHRAARRVHPADCPPRSALTTIYYLLPRGAHSRWHRLRSDEVWHFHEGDPLELLTLEPGEDAVRRQLLGPVGATTVPVAVVPPGAWQAARSTGAYSLVGCTVGPGFEFDDFRLLADEPAEAAAFRERFPAYAHLI